MEFESDDDVAEPLKNAETAKKEGKVRVTKKMIHYYEFSSDEEEEEHADPKKKEKQVPSRTGYRMFIDISSFRA